MFSSINAMQDNNISYTVTRFGRHNVSIQNLGVPDYDVLYGAGHRRAGLLDAV